MAKQAAARAASKKTRSAKKTTKKTSAQPRKTVQPIVKDQVYEKLRLEIISFELKPGERISESQLATRLGVGIASIRAVLPKLVQEGLIINQRRMGHVISPITMQDVHDICQLREILEPQASELAAENIDIDLLESIDERSKQSIPKGDRKAEMESLLANRDFHVAIAQASGNERLRSWIAQLQDFSIRFQYLLRHSPPLSSEWEHSHEPIIEAFKKRDPQLSRELMLEHLSRGREHMMKAILQLPNLQDLNIGSLMQNMK